VTLQAAGGAVAGAGAAFNAVAGNLLGLVVTPALVLLALPGAIPGEVQLTKQLIKLGSQVRNQHRQHSFLFDIALHCVSVTVTMCVHSATCKHCVDRYMRLQQQHRAMLSIVRAYVLRHLLYSQCSTATAASIAAVS
jgi:hypothetical protein